jgi:hypothetical protein
MDTRYFRAAAAVLGAIGGVWMMLGMSVSPARAWTDNDPAGINSCDSPVVNDAATVAGNCLDTNDTDRAFVRLASASSSTFLAALPSTVGGTPCNATGINNAAAGSENIIGWCADGNSVIQGVFWNSATPATAPTLLRPLSLLGLLANVQTGATKVNLAGVIIGVSIDGEGTRTPVSWSASGAPTELAPPLLAVNADCTPVDINDARTPSIIGNCDDSGNGGGNRAVLWQGTGAAYTSLPVPIGADYCEVTRVNLAGQILGQCIYPGDVYRVAVWGAGGSAAIVLMTVGSAAAPQTFPAGINDSGMVACNYMVETESPTLVAPCLWTPTGGNTAATAITSPGGAATPAIALSIGNNGKIAGIYVTATLAIHPFHVESGSTTAVDDGSPDGGPNTTLTAMSRGGLFVVAEATDATLLNHAFGLAVP